MNKAYRLIWNSARCTWMVAAETVKGKKGSAIGAAMVAAALCCGRADALPIAPQVVNGQASFSTSGSTLTVTNSDRAIINWGAFNIGAGETTRFIQPTSLSAVLNRVTGGNPSAIYGTLQSNGRVYLINQRGILIGPDARIDAHSFVASTLAMQDRDFLAGRIRFSGDPLSGRIDNQGVIRTPAGGSIYLIAPDIANSGIIHAPGGQVLLAAGHQVSLVDSADPDLAVVVSAPEDQVLNLGSIIAEAGKVGISGGLIRQKGLASASSAVSEGGRIFFRASRGVELSTESTTAADGTRGGTIIAKVEENGRLRGALSAKGALSARGDGSGGSGGFVETSAASVDPNGARVDTAGGTWLIDPTNIFIADTLALAQAGGMTGSDASADFSLPPDFSASATVPDSFLSTATVAGGLVSNNVLVTTANPAGSGTGNIRVLSPLSWISANELKLQADGNISVDAPVSGTAGSLILQAGGAISQTQPISVNSLGTSSVTGTLLAAANNVNSYSAANSGTGSIVFNNDAGAAKLLMLNGLNVDNTGTGNISITNNGPLETVGWIQTADGSISLTANNGAATIGNSVIAAGNGAIDITATGAAGDISLNIINLWSNVLTSGLGDGNGSLSLNAGGDISMQASVSAGDIAMAAGGTISTTSGTTLTAGGNVSLTTTLPGASISTASGSSISSTSGGILLQSLNTTSGITSAGIYSAVAGNITLSSNTALNLDGGTFTSGPGGTVTLASASGGIIQTGGVIDIPEATGTLQLSPAPGMAVTLDKALNRIRATINGINAGNIKIHGDANGLRLGNITHSGTLDLNSTGPISGAGTITGGIGTSLIAQAAGGITLNGTNGSRSVSLSNSGSGDIVYTSTTGPGNTLQITANNLGPAGSVTITESGGSLNISAPSGTAGLLTLSAPAGSITQSAGAPLGSTSLLLNGANVFLEEANPVGVVAGIFSGTNFSYTSQNLLTASAINGTSGIQSTGNGTIKLQSPAGINQQPGAIIATAGTLDLITAGQVMLNVPGNSVASLSAAAAGGVDFTNGSSLSVGSGGISTTNAPVRIGLPPSGSTLTVTGNISAGTGNVDLTAANIAVSALAADVDISGDRVALTATEPGIGYLSMAGSPFLPSITAINGVKLTADGMISLPYRITASDPVSGGINLSGYTFNRPISLGPTPADSLHPCFVTSSCLQISSLPDTGTTPFLSFGADSAAPNPSGTIYLNTALGASGKTLGFASNGGIIQEGGGISADYLGFKAGGTVDLTGGSNMIATVAGATTSGGISINNGMGLAIGSLSGPGFTIDGLSSPSAVTLTLASGGISDLLPSVPAITAPVVSLTAQDGIGLGFGAAGTPLKTQTGTLTAANYGTSGDINVLNSGSLFTSGWIGNGNPGNAAGGRVTIRSNDALTIGGAGSTGGISALNDVWLEAGAGATGGTTGTLKIDGDVYSDTNRPVLLMADSGLVLNGTVNGGDITARAGSQFVNNSGPTAINAAGRWLVWSADPALDVRGGLVYGFKQYNATYGSTPVAGSGNGFLYSIAPVLTPTLVGTVARVYDGTTSASLTAANFGTTAGAIDGDLITFGTLSGVFDSRNVGSGKTVTVTGLSPGAVDGSATVYGYTLSSTSVSGPIGTITPAPLTTSGALAQSRIYDGTTAATVTPGTLIGVLGGDAVTVAATGAFADKNVGAGKNVTATFALTGTDAGNYTISAPTPLLADITPRSVSVTSVTALDKIYDGTTAAALSGGTLSGLITGDAVSVSGSGAFADRHAGSGKTVTITGLSLSGSDAGNYLIATGSVSSTTASIGVRPAATWISSGGGLWSDASNWDALPDRSNVLSVVIPPGTGSVTYDATAGTTLLDSLSSQREIALAGGSLGIRLNLDTTMFRQTGGALGGTGNLAVSGTFLQSGGTIALGGTANANLFQAAGNISIDGISVPSLTVIAPAGAISQTGPITAASLATVSAHGTSLTRTDNRIANYSGKNTGTGDIRLGNGIPLFVTGIDNTGGGFTLDNQGAVITGPTPLTLAGTLSMTARSPLTVGSGGVDAGSDVVLVASAAGGADHLTLDGPVRSGGNITLSAGGSIIENAPIQAAGTVARTANLNLPPLSSCTAGQIWDGTSCVTPPPPTTQQPVTTAGDQVSDSLITTVNNTTVTVPVSTITTETVAPYAAPPAGSSEPSSPSSPSSSSPSTGTGTSSATDADGGSSPPPAGDSGGTGEGSGSSEEQEDKRDDKRQEPGEEQNGQRGEGQGTPQPPRRYCN